MSARTRMLGEYVAASTANPTGWRPWNSRLGFYLPNSFPLPTTGRGPFLFQPGVPVGPPMAAGGLGQSDDSMNLSIDPTLLLAGGGVLLLAFLLWGGKKTSEYRGRRRSRKRRKIQHKIAQLQLQAEGLR